MRSIVKNLLHDITPPILWRKLLKCNEYLHRKYYTDHEIKEWEYIPEGWAYAKTHREIKGWNVPDVLLSGNHEEINKWRRRESLKRTFERRPDLLKRVNLSEYDRAVLKELEMQFDLE